MQYFLRNYKKNITIKNHNSKLFDLRVAMVRVT